MLMLPAERELVRKLAGKPFTLLGIHSGESRSALEKVLREQRITWPTIHDGWGDEAKIAPQWNIAGWPTIYVLDQEGVIRYRELEGPQLEQAVMELLAQVPKPR